MGNVKNLVEVSMPAQIRGVKRFGVFKNLTVAHLSTCIYLELLPRPHSVSAYKEMNKLHNWVLLRATTGDR